MTSIKSVCADYIGPGITKFAGPFVSSIVSTVEIGLGIKERIEQGQDLQKLEIVKARATRRHSANSFTSELANASIRTCDKGIKATQSKIWKGYVNIASAAVNTFNSVTTLYVNFSKELEKEVTPEKET